MKELPGAHRSWVEHILLFVLPRQIVALGDPCRRSCDACESLGARFKKVIKHLTCRRNLQPKQTRAQADAAWRSSFTVGWVEQAFKRIVVEESLQHGEENREYMLREDARLRKQGLRGVKKEHKGPSRASGEVPSIVDALADALAAAAAAPTPADVPMRDT